tara:strand:- start:224 stop:403 length:180 start_codon:yes stop_codon:yes gene_type:complete
MKYTDAKWMKEWSVITKKRKIELDWDLPNLNVLIRQDGLTRVVPLTLLVDSYMLKEEYE